jgi:hypothetical protein
VAYLAGVHELRLGSRRERWELGDLLGMLFMVSEAMWLEWTTYLIFLRCIYIWCL